jgi:hypothetical protein
VFAGEPIAPSKRVLARWDRDQVGWLARTLGPGVMRAALTLLSIGLLAQAALMTVSLLSLVIVPRPRPADVASVVIVGGYAASFMVFLAGFGAFVRARSNLSTTTRVMLLVMLFGVGAGPWILAAIAGAVRHDEGLLLAAPSPIFALVAAADVRRALMTTRHAEMIASISMSALWALGGLVLLARAASRCRAIVHAHDEALRQGDAMLAAEDAALAAAPSPPEPAPPAGAG